VLFREIGSFLLLAHHREASALSHDALDFRNFVTRQNDELSWVGAPHEGRAAVTPE
jgi:hypothetical protein